MKLFMKVTAPAKLNLFLHITGRRNDGYHLLESVFVFTEFGDFISIFESDSLSFTIDGQFQSRLSDALIENNIAYRAALLLQKKYHIASGASIYLTKNIPVGAGLGGGSTDAAAVLKGLNQFWNLNIDKKTLMELGLTLGADVPACISAQSAFVSGIGENINAIDLSFMPKFILLVNPCQSLSTSAIFQQYKKENKSFTAPLNDEIDFSTIQKSHNDLESAAIKSIPDTQTLLTILKQQKHCAFARMSGSGPTCFALFHDMNSAKLAEQVIQKQLPTYWIQLTKLCIT